MIIHRSILFCERVAIEVEHLEREYRFARGNVLVEAFRDGQTSGFSFYDSRSVKRCNVFTDPKTDKPVMDYGLKEAFDERTGLPRAGSDRVTFATGDPKVVANHIMRYYTDSVA